MKKVILFYPIIEHRQSHLLPLSLLLVAAPLVKAGYPVKIIDQRVELDWKEKLLKELRENPLLVGISALTGRQLSYGLTVSKLVKENSEALVVWGGVHVSLLPEQSLENKFINIVVVGEGEETLLELVKRLKEGENYKDVLGIGYKEGEKVYINPRRDFIDLDKQPDIPYHLVEVEKYISKISFATGKPARELVIYTSRGCPHRCAFCYNKEYNFRRWRAQSAEKVISEIEKLISRYQITSFGIQDDEFFTDLKRVKKICELLQLKKIKVNFICSCRIDYICRMAGDFLNLIKKNGFDTLELGVESGSPKILEMIKKDILQEQVIKAVKILNKYSIGGKYCFMVGFPKETMKDVWQTVDLMREIKKINPYSRIPEWRIFTPYPGTNLYQLSLKNGFLPPQNLKEWANYDFQTVRAPWINKKLEAIIKNVAFLVKFLRLQDKPLSFIHRWWGRWVDIRWRHHWFYFLPEKFIFNLYKRFKKAFLYPVVKL